MDTPIIEFERVSKIYQGGAGPVTALHDVTLRIAAGEFIALIGPSGCGKSTLMRLIGDLEQPSNGTVRIKAKTPDQARRDRDYGIVFQSPVLYDWRTIRKNVELPLEIMGRPKEQRHQRAMELLKLVGLGDFGDAYPHQLSGGMQQRASIARALSFAPSILLMDEPFGALDEITRERLQLELLSIWWEAEPRPTVIFVTHSIPEAVFLADRVVVMSPRPGRVQRVVEVNLARPRAFETREDPQFFALVTEVRECLRATETAG
ncbi:ABC transporter ATP-binding protein [Candidatus Chloroploca mongolica]|uniref:ABC transporter ATP-binding protein n=1 Tax=Candidatus Chloroploca mongolica TaxID=2528176 RepID=UPI0010813C77|nr:ABC transporter ATP-binding protein [Candidatus Chloroploca mongolica]NCC34463.1 ABC transporter ATP-binding protein [Chloroflexia bacterium]